MTAKKWSFLTVFCLLVGFFIVSPLNSMLSQDDDEETISFDATLDDEEIKDNELIQDKSQDEAENKKPLKSMHADSNSPFTQNSSLKVHQSRLKTKKPYHCNYEDCKKSFKYSSELKKHQLSHTTERPHRCEMKNCGKYFKTTEQLKAHKKRHNPEKTYYCDQKDCKKSFKTEIDLKAHKKRHDSERLHHCGHNDCNGSFKTERELKFHQQLHNPEKNYHCDHNGCKKSFKTERYLKLHKKCHNPEKNHHCSCGKSFKTEKRLKVHENSHTNRITILPNEAIVSFNGIQNADQHVCQWLGCDAQPFKNAKELYYHGCKTHMSPDENGVRRCLWKNCKKRQRGAEEPYKIEEAPTKGSREKSDILLKFKAHFQGHAKYYLFECTQCIPIFRAIYKSNIERHGKSKHNSRDCYKKIEYPAPFQEYEQSPALSNQVVLTKSPQKLSNLGNSCFINAGIQCLQSLTNFLEVPYEHHYNQPLTRSFIELLEEVKKDNLYVQNPLLEENPFLQKLNLFCNNVRENIFKNNNFVQEDSAELIGGLLDALFENTCLQKNPGYIDFQPEDKSNYLLSCAQEDPFSSILISTKTCISCEAISPKKEYYNMLSCEVAGEKNSLLNCIADFFKSEEVQAKCEACSINQDVSCVKKLTLTKAPENLIIQAKIFSHDGQIGEKKNGSLPFPLKELSLQEYCNEQIACTYDLTGLILHGGQTLDQGHYIALVKTNDGKWYLCDDDIITSVSAEQIEEIASTGRYMNLNTEQVFIPYVWFYKQINENVPQGLALETDQQTIQKSNQQLSKCKCLGCDDKSFKNAKELYEHCCRKHMIADDNGMITCLWDGCVKRNSKDKKPFSIKNDAAGQFRFKKHLQIHANYYVWECTKKCNRLGSRQFEERFMKKHCLTSHKDEKCYNLILYN